MGERKSRVQLWLEQSQSHTHSTFRPTSDNTETTETPTSHWGHSRTQHQTQHHLLKHSVDNNRQLARRASNNDRRIIFVRGLLQPNYRT